MHMSFAALTISGGPFDQDDRAVAKISRGASVLSTRAVANYHLKAEETSGARQSTEWVGDSDGLRLGGRSRHLDARRPLRGAGESIDKRCRAVESTQWFWAG